MCLPGSGVIHVKEGMSHLDIDRRRNLNWGPPVSNFDPANHDAVDGVQSGINTCAKQYCSHFVFSLWWTAISTCG